MKLIEQIKASALLLDLDDAIRPIQDILGVTDGGFAGVYWSGSENLWFCSLPNIRERLLQRYIEAEMRMAEVGDLRA